MSKLAKALYDNTAECADELAFRRGDIITVMDQNVAGTSGWWMCSLYGRHGLAPANRLQLLPQTGTTAGSPSFFSTMSSPTPDVYDVPIKARQTSPLTASTAPRHMSRKHSLIPNLRLEESFNSPESLRCSSPTDSYVYAVPPPLHQDPNYDIPVPSATETQKTSISGYKTLPNPQKSEWIYDVPVGSESPHQASYDTLPSKAVCRQLHGTGAMPILKDSPTPSVYDIPKHSSVDIWSPRKELPEIPIYDKPTKMPTQASVYVPAQEELLTRGLSDPPSDHIPLEWRVDPNNAHELKRVRLQRMRNFLAVTSFHDLPGIGQSLVQEDDERGRTLRVTLADSQRISTASSSSTSSCDSLALSSSSPEPLREVTLSQDEACRRLLDLQESICRAVPQLMEFVSSHWRRREHLEKHLKEIKEAAEAIACSVTCFLNFALDIKGNAHRLTDANLQTRLYKQLSIVEDSGVILQQTVGALAMAGWPLNLLCQDPDHVQTPDQLERFVMVARTVPEDVKRLVSITNANGKLLFRSPQKDPESLNTTGQPDTKKSSNRNEQGGDSVEDDNDYVELQNETEKQQKEVQRRPKQTAKPVSNKAQADNKRHSCESNNGTKNRSSSMTEHCRLYFGALQKAIGGFVGSLQDGQPPEKFISHSKLVIMVGQRLVDTLCREAQCEGSNQSLLCKSNHLCALLKQLAVATKKAALHFPDKQALHEAQEFAKELAQKAQHFRISLDL
ncbi:cas scaffolding protein family member 4 isoform X2 [Anabas testudineus]|uniref:cas scaffolding protein family member 4 isoform X2 n=1 Tax=Anabas testudineus TaxID=64144 RepID=UPI000E45B645|nr:cas scaffolding protein family member 4 isoform X2 [Anabas testudineus]